MTQTEDAKELEDNTLTYVLERITKMLTERSKIEGEWATSELQVEAPSSVDNDMKIQFNSQTEQSLCEQYVGRVNNQIYRDFKPEQEADAAELYASQKIENYFLEKENFYSELARWDFSKSIYGMGIFYTGLTLDIETKYKPKEWATADPEDPSGWVDDDSQFEEYKQYNRQFTPKNVRPRDFLWDNRNFRQDKWELIEDCARIEYVSKERLTQRRADAKEYNIEWLEEMTWADRSNMNSHIYVVKLTHYYNKNTKDYIIMGNDCQIIHKGKMKYKHGRLPFEVAQHYPDNNCICGKWIPRKTRASKAYKNNMLQAAIDKVWASSFSNIVLGNANVLNNKYQMWWGMNVWETTSMSDFQQFQTDGNITGLEIAINLMNEEIRNDTGEDPRLDNINPQEKLWQTEIKEENKAIRLKTLHISRDICLDNALTSTYCNIQQFAPAVLRKEEKIDGETTKVIRPMISLPWIKVKKKGNKQLVEDVTDYWVYWWYELNPKFRMIDGVCKIVTNSSYNKQWSVLEKNKFSEFMDNKLKQAQIWYPVAQMYPYETIKELENQAYGYDPDMKFTAKTKKDKIREKNLEMVEAFKQMTWGGVLDSMPTDEATNGQTTWGAPQLSAASQALTWWMWGAETQMQNIGGWAAWGI